MLDGIWNDYYLYPEEFERDRALKAVYMFLSAMYPICFTNAGSVNLPVVGVDTSIVGA